MARVELETGIKHATFGVTSPTEEMARKQMEKMLQKKYGSENVSINENQVNILGVISEMIWK